MRFRSAHWSGPAEGARMPGGPGVAKEARGSLAGSVPSIRYTARAAPAMERRANLMTLAAMMPTGLLLLALVGGAVVFAADGARVIAFPYPMDYGEGPLLAQTRALGNRENIYRADLASPPYTISNYPPLYPFVLSPVARLAGPAFWYGRLLSWLSIAAAATLIGLIVQALTGDRLAAVVGGLALLAFPPASYWAGLYRVDAFALALSLGGLYVCVRRPDARGTVPLAALLLTAAIFTRQSYGLAAPLAATAWLLATGRRRRALTLLGLVAALGAALFGGLEWLTRGGFSFNVVTANLNAYQAGSLARYLADVWALMPIALTAAGLFLLVAGALRVPSWRLVGPYLIGAALSGLTIGKVGSNVNYLLELGAAVALALDVVRLARAPPGGDRGGVAAAGARRGPDGPGLSLPRGDPRPPRPARGRAPAGGAGARGRRDRARRRGHGPAGEGRPAHLLPAVRDDSTRARGAMGPAPAAGDIERQAFAAILIYAIPEVPLHRDRWTDEMLRAIEQRYTVSERVGQTLVFRPRRGG